MDTVPAAILPAAYRWTIRDGTEALLHRNYGGAAHVFRHGGRYRVTISENGASVSGPAATLAQGMRHAERWIDAASRRTRVPKRIAQARRRRDDRGDSLGRLPAANLFKREAFPT